MNVDYNKIADKFSASRKNMKWEEISYFISSYLSSYKNKSFLDVGCGSGRLLDHFSMYFDLKYINYFGMDLSSDMIENAKFSFPDKKFFVRNMLDLDNFNNNSFDYIFFIASFHHLPNISDRLKVLEKANKILKKGGLIFMTNWSLDSSFNREKYIKNRIFPSNEFGSFDYNINFGDYSRYYHGFTISELNYLFKDSGFDILENREFDNERNFISILKKV